MSSLVRQFLLLPFVFISLVQAATEYLPPTSSSDQIAQQDQVNEIQKLLPFSKYNAINYIQLQNTTLGLLRARFPKFDQWASEKPDPITINIYKKSVQAELTYLLKDEHYNPLQEAVFIALSQRVQQAGALTDLAKVTEFVSKMKSETLSQILQNLLGGADSVRGFITGLLQALPPERRGEIFKAGEPLEQLRLIESSGLTDEQLRNSSFQAERFGLDSKTMTLKQVLEAIRGRMNSHQTLLVQLGQMAILEKTNSEAMKLFFNVPTKTNFQKILQPQDFRFFDGNPSPFLAQLEESLVRINPKQEAKVRKALEQALAAVPKTWFERRSEKIEVNIPYAKVIEVHPYLGVYRGCVGGDCSTSASPMYPFSPWEHDFYIALPDGSIVGYISATRVLANGKPSLYLKDISGRTLSAEMAEAIIHAFSKVYQYYGVENYLLANYGFTNGQNHFQVLRSMLAKYNGYEDYQRSGNPQNIQILNVTFPDADIRNYIQTERQMYSTSSYDSPGYHTTGAVFVPNSGIMNLYNVEFNKGTLSPFKPNTPRESLLHALRLLSADPNAKIADIPDVVESEVKGVFASLKNPSNLPLANYYSSVESIFKKYGIELSRTFRQSNENFFIAGHLNASDAMSTVDESMKTDTERFFITYCRRFKNIEGISFFITKWSAQLQQMKRLPEFMDLLSSRGEDFDIALLLTFASLNFEPAKEALKKINSQERTESVIVDYLFGNKVNWTGPEVRPRSHSTFFFLMSDAIQGAYNSYTAPLEKTMVTALASVGLQLENLKNRKLIANLGLVWMRSHPNFPKEPYRDLFFGAIKDALNNKEISISDFYVAMAFSNRATIKRLDSLLEWRSEYLANSKKGDLVESAFEVYVLSQFGRGSEAKLLQTGLFHKGHLEIIKSLAVNQKVPEKLLALIEDFRIRAGGELLSGYNVIVQEILNTRAGSIDQYYSDIERHIRPFGIKLNQLLSVPELKGIISRSHLSHANAFASSSKVHTGRSLDWLAESILKGEDTSRAMQNLMNSLEVIKGNPQFTNFVRRISSATKVECTESCAKVLAQLAGSGIVLDGIDFSEKALVQMLATNDPFAKTFAAVRLLEKNPKFVVQQRDLLVISKLLANDDEAKFPDSLLNFSEAAMDVLNLVRSNLEEIQEELRETIKEDENIRMVLKGAMAFIKNGGAMDDIKKYVRRALAELPEKEGTLEVRRLLVHLKNLTQGYDFEFAPGSCTFVFATSAKSARK